MGVLNKVPVSINNDTSASYDFVCLELSIDDAELLCKMLVEVALGRYGHAIKILSGRSKYTDSQLNKMAVTSARRLFALQKKGKPYHRDGWIFQVISWIAAHVSYPNAIHRAPQIIHADKGLDGISVTLNDPSTDIAYCVISEDKATQDPEHTFKYKVIPELVRFESGQESSLITSGISGLIERFDLVNQDDIIASTLWNGNIRYRVSVTTLTPIHNSAQGKVDIFKDFTGTVVGNNDRRVAVTMHDGNFRTTLDNLVTRCLELLQEREDRDV